MDPTTPSLFDEPPSTPPKTVYQLHQEELARTAELFGPPPPKPDPQVEDLALGERRKAAGQGHAEQATPDPYAVAFRATVKRVAATQPEFVVDDITRVVGFPRASQTNRNNAVGALLHGMAKMGYIVATGRTRKSHRSLSNARRVLIWTRGPALRGDEEP